MTLLDELTQNPLQSIFVLTLLTAVLLLQLYRAQQRFVAKS